MLGAAFKFMDPSHSKDNQNCLKMEPPGGPFSSVLELLRACLGLFDQHEISSCKILTQPRGHGSEFSTKFLQNNTFLDFDTLLERNGRFWGLEGSKLRPSGLQGAVLRRSGRPRRSWTGSTERSGQQNLIVRFGLAVGVMETVANKLQLELRRSSKSI